MGMYSEAMNYNPSATVDTDPTSCVLKVEGCTDGTTDDGNPTAINYNEFATLKMVVVFIFLLFLMYKSTCM